VTGFCEKDIPHERSGHLMQLDLLLPSADGACGGMSS
jgi:hypothetical protein